MSGHKWCTRKELCPLQSGEFRFESNPARGNAVQSASASGTPILTWTPQCTISCRVSASAEIQATLIDTTHFIWHPLNELAASIFLSQHCVDIKPCDCLNGVSDSEPSHIYRPTSSLLLLFLFLILNYTTSFFVMLVLVLAVRKPGTLEISTMEKRIFRDDVCA